MYKDSALLLVCRILIVENVKKLYSDIRGGRLRDLSGIRRTMHYVNNIKAHKKQYTLPQRTGPPLHI